MTATLLKPVTRTGTHARASGSADRDAPFYARLDNEIVLVADYRPAVSERVRLQRGRFHTTLAAHPAATELVVLAWADDLTQIDDGRYQLIDTGAPVDGVDGTGALVAGEGSFYTDVDAGALYVNSGSVAAPVWQAQGGGSGGVNVDNGTDPPAAVTTLVAPGAVIMDGTADLSAVLQLRLIGPFSIDYTMGALLSSEVELDALASGTYVLNAWAFVTTHWTASPPLGENDLHMNIGVGNATDGTALATADAALSARDADPGLPFALTENVANGAAGVSKSIVKVTDDGQFLCVDMQNFGAALTAGAADIYAIIAVPAS
jgi:hypothetical protein